MKEPFPIFSGPGNILLLYLFLAFYIFAPEEITPKSLIGISAAVGILGLPLGTLINSVYHSTWSLLWGYGRAGHCGVYYREYKKRLDKETILAIHDRILWQIAPKDSIEYFRRRWTSYHFSFQIGLVSLFSTPFPFLITYFFDTGRNLSSFCLYLPPLILIFIVSFINCRYTSRGIHAFIGQLYRGYEKNLEVALEIEARAKERGKGTA